MSNKQLFDGTSGPRNKASGTSRTAGDSGARESTKKLAAKNAANAARGKKK
jgi:hypothetical protein